MTKIYLAIQIVLVVLLLVMGFYFQSKLTSEGRSPRFFHSMVWALVFQLGMFYPIKKFADREAQREVDSSVPGLDFDTLKKLRNKRTVADVIKSGVFVFFLTFIWKAPQDTFVLSTLFMSFIFTYVSYFQCLNFLIKKAITEQK
jgi:hypothetical protein